MKNGFLTRGYDESKSANERASRVIAGGVNSNVRLQSSPCPLTFDNALGSRITDVDGNEYVDYAMGMGPHILGHSPATVLDAVRDALGQGQLFAGQHRHEAEFAELVVSTIPWVQQVRIGLSGTEMNLLALRVCRAITGRQKFVRFEGHYHGWLDPLFVVPQSGIGTPTRQPHLSRGQSAASATDVVVLPWNDLEALEDALSTGEVGAVLMEPIMCNTGVIEADDGYVARARQLCEKNGALLIVDEVITGFRIGLLGAQGTLGVNGHFTVYAKAIASGFPVAVLGAEEGLLDEVGTGAINHSGTYNTGISSIVAGIATIRELLAHPPYDHMDRLGQSLATGLVDVGESRRWPLAVDGGGSVFQVRFGVPEAPRTLEEFHRRSDKPPLEDFIRLMQDAGVRMTSRGLMFLSAAHTDADVDRTLSAADSALERMSAQ